jgi:hypothetical protein
MITQTSYSVIVPVWGKVHVDRFLDWALPSWLSPRNLPYLASSGPVEVIVLAGKLDIARISENAVVALLVRSCQLRFVEIDDLVAGDVATVTLTLAFTRGANAAMAGAKRPRLIFLNADFLLTDGSIASIARRFDAGQRKLLCASVRVREEVTSPRLARMRQADGSMIAPAREMVRLALEALHPTVLACCVDQPLLTSARPNQFFWRSGASTLVLRSFLLFPLAVLPEKSPGRAEIYCDYGWIEEFAPGAPFDIVDDSDEILIVELAPTNQELDFVRPGPPDIVECARRMSAWMTEFSRRQPLTPIIFHACDKSENSLAESKVLSAAFVTDLLRHFGVSHSLKAHPYWLGGAAAYIRNRKQIGVDAIPPELMPPPRLPKRNLALSSRLRNTAKSLLLGRPGRRRRWHPLWRAERLLRRVGALNVVALTSLIGELDIVSSPIGAPLGILELEEGKSVADVVANLVKAVAPEQHGYLILGHGISAAAQAISIMESILALDAIERQFTILSCLELMTANEALALSRHRSLASEFHLVSLTRLWGLLLASLVSIIVVVKDNLKRFPPPNRLGTPSAALLLQVQRTSISRPGI